MNKKMVLFLVLLSGMIILLVIYLSLGRTQSPVVQTSSPRPSSQTINQQGDKIILEKNTHRILFLNRFNSYVIEILSSPFAPLRVQAEQDLLKTLNLTAAQACSLSVTTVTDKKVNPNEANQEYRLSFCPPSLPSPIPTPSVTIQPNLSPLTIKAVSPRPGSVPMGDTTNAIMITFTKPVNEQAAAVNIEPRLQLQVVVRADDPTRLIIYPATNWETNQNYIITLKAGLLSKDGLSQTKEDVVLKYTTTGFAPPRYTQEP